MLLDIEIICELLTCLFNLCDKEYHPIVIENKCKISLREKQVILGMKHDKLSSIGLGSFFNYYKFSYYMKFFLQIC